MLRARNATNVRVELSAQCMSSRISTTGAGVGQQVEQLEHRLEQTYLTGWVGTVIARAAVVEPREDRRQLAAAPGAERRRAPGCARARADAGRSAAARRAARRRTARRPRRAETTPAAPRRRPAAAPARRPAASSRRRSHRRAGRGRAGRQLASRTASINSASSPTRPTKCVLVSLDLMSEVSPDAGHDPGPRLRASDPAAPAAADEFVGAARRHVCAELGMHSAFLSIACNVI